MRADSGYASAAYAESLAAFGRPRPLPQAGGWLLERPIPGSDLRDAMGPYPLFCCADWSALGRDLAGFAGELVSLLVVTDPFGPLDRAELAALFPDLTRAYKPHFVVDLQRPLFESLPTHHRRNLRRALAGVEVEICTTPRAWLEDWVALYDVLIQRHAIRGIAAFSRASFARQFEVPGLLVLRAREGDRTVAMHLWLRDGARAYYHLGAASARGYELRAAYALMHAALEHFAREGLAWADIGAGAGADPRADDGLTRFKAGWATGTRPVHLCGRIFDRAAYTGLAERCAAPRAGYFPLYRSGEFA